MANTQTLINEKFASADSIGFPLSLEIPEGFAKGMVFPLEKGPYFTGSAAEKLGDDYKFENENFAILEDIAVYPENRGRFISEILLSGFIQECKELGLSSLYVKAIQLEQTPFNVAKWFNRYGFEETVAATDKRPALLKLNLKIDRSNLFITGPKEVTSAEIIGSYHSLYAPRICDYLHLDSTPENFLRVSAALDVKDGLAAASFAIIHEMSVCFDHDELGFEEEMLKEFTAVAKSRNMDSVLLLVDDQKHHQFNQIDWYEKFGFKTVDIALESGTLMQLKLNN